MEYYYHVSMEIISSVMIHPLDTTHGADSMAALALS